MDDFLQVILEETEKVFKPIINAPFEDDVNDVDDVQDSDHALENEEEKEKRKINFFDTQNSELSKCMQCKHCFQKFNKRTDLDLHLQKRHQDQRPFTCEQCEKRFSTKNILKQHQRIHTKEKPYCCQYCYKCFSHRTALANHIRTHTGEKPFDCNFCSKSFGEKAKLLLHMRVHTGEKPFRCSHCQRAFRDKSSYNVHLRIHTGEKPFCCHYCQRCFTHRNSFKDHLRIHTGERPFVCIHCKRDFAKQSTLRKHLEVHGVVKPFELHLHAIIKPTQQAVSIKNDLQDDPDGVTTRNVKFSNKNRCDVTSGIDSEQSLDVVKLMLRGKKKRNDISAQVNTLLGSLHENQIHVCVFCRSLYEDSDSLDTHLQSHPVESRIWKIGCDLIYLFTSILGLDVISALGFNRRDYQQVIEEFMKILRMKKMFSLNDNVNDPILGIQDKLRSLFTALISKRECDAIKLDRVNVLDLLYDMVIIYPLCDDAK